VFERERGLLEIVRPCLPASWCRPGPTHRPRAGHPATAYAPYSCVEDSVYTFRGNKGLTCGVLCVVVSEPCSWHGPTKSFSSTIQTAKCYTPDMKLHYC
jgi:hypothetical protein